MSSYIVTLSVPYSRHHSIQHAIIIINPRHARPNTHTHTHTNHTYANTDNMQQSTIKWESGTEGEIRTQHPDLSHKAVAGLHGLPIT